jgi:hypothetical protein
MHQIRFGIFLVYQFHPGTYSLKITLIGFGPKQAIIIQSEMNSLHVDRNKKFSSASKVVRLLFAQRFIIRMVKVNVIFNDIRLLICLTPLQVN